MRMNEAGQTAERPAGVDFSGGVERDDQRAFFYGLAFADMYVEDGAIAWRRNIQSDLASFQRDEIVFAAHHITGANVHFLHQHFALPATTASVPAFGEHGQADL